MNEVRYAIGRPTRCPPGKSICWCADAITQWWHPDKEYETPGKAIEACREMMLVVGSRRGFVNYKHNDASMLETFIIDFYPRLEPTDWSWLNPRKWFRRNPCQLTLFPDMKMEPLTS
jgi:hypothetical protein